MSVEITKNSNPIMNVKLSPEIIAAQGQNDREYLTLRMKLLLEAKEKMPELSIDEFVSFANVACGQGSCCCCPPQGTCCTFSFTNPIDGVTNPVSKPV